MSSSLDLKDLQDTDLRAELTRIYKDFEETAKVFDAQKVSRTIAFFGSHRIMSWDRAQQEMRDVDVLFHKSKRRTQKQWDALDKASNAIFMSRYYDAAEELAYNLSTWSKKHFKKPEEQFVVCSGGGPGIMDATNKGSTKAGERSIGLTIDIAAEQAKNIHITPELKFTFDHFFIRKFWFFYYVKAVIVFPGGMGTLDELFELINMIKTDKLSRNIPVVLYGKEYWDEIVDFSRMVRFNTINPEDLDCLHMSDSVDDAFSYLKEKLEALYL